jgi:hypothetical protein
MKTLLASIMVASLVVGCDSSGGDHPPPSGTAGSNGTAGKTTGTGTAGTGGGGTGTGTAGTGPKESCQGTPMPCSAIFGQDLCTAQLACLYTPTDCEGLEKSCQSFDLDASCNNQDGCSWIGDLTTGSCEGVATPCILRTTANCGAGSTTGCDIKIGHCDGTVEPCSTFFTADECLNQFGCEWR